MKNRLILFAVLWTLPVRAVTYGTPYKAHTPAVHTSSVYTSAPTMRMRSTSTMSAVYTPSVQSAAPTVYMRSTSPSSMMMSSAAPSYTNTAFGGSSPSKPYRPVRRAKPEGDGSGGGTVVDGGETWYWDEESEDWVNIPPVGTIKEEGGIMYEWNGSGWVVKGQIADLGTPVGDTPWLWIMLLAVAFALIRGRKVKFNS